MCSVPIRLSPRCFASSTAAVIICFRSSRWDRFVIASSLSILRMDGLSGDTERVADLLPRPTALAGKRDVLRLDLFGETLQGADSAETNRRVVRIDGTRHVAWSHVVNLA